MHLPSVFVGFEVLEITKERREAQKADPARRVLSSPSLPSNRSLVPIFQFSTSPPPPFRSSPPSVTTSIRRTQLTSSLQEGHPMSSSTPFPECFLTSSPSPPSPLMPQPRNTSPQLGLGLELTSVLWETGCWVGLKATRRKGGD